MLSHMKYDHRIELESVTHILPGVCRGKKQLHGIKNSTLFDHN
jgi:hypothetical protein